MCSPEAALAVAEEGRRRAGADEVRQPAPAPGNAGRGRAGARMLSWVDACDASPPPGEGGASSAEDARRFGERARHERREETIGRHRLIAREAGRVGLEYPAERGVLAHAAVMLGAGRRVIVLGQWRRAGDAGGSTSFVAHDAMMRRPNHKKHEEAAYDEAGPRFSRMSHVIAFSIRH